MELKYEDGYWRVFNGNDAPNSLEKLQKANNSLTRKNELLHRQLKEAVHVCCQLQANI